MEWKHYCVIVYNIIDYFYSMEGLMSEKEKEKKNYLNPLLEIVVFNRDEVLCGSIEDDNDNDFGASDLNIF